MKLMFPVMITTASCVLHAKRPAVRQAFSFVFTAYHYLDTDPKRAILCNKFAQHFPLLQFLQHDLSHTEWHFT